MYKGYNVNIVKICGVVCQFYLKCRADILRSLRHIMLFWAGFMAAVCLTCTVARAEHSDFSYPSTTGSCIAVYDPLEKMNRKIFVFNGVLDYFLLRPITLTYRSMTNDYVKSRVTSFVDNISTPFTVLQYGFQMNYNSAMKGIWRFIINSTFGILGAFDVAHAFGLDLQKQTIGSTLAYYGVGPGPYLILPFSGSTNTRDAIDNFFGLRAFNDILYSSQALTTGAMIAQTIDARMSILDFTDYVARTSLDPYISIRSATQQARESTLKYPVNFKCPKIN